jgi:hypothetical protein
MRHPHTPPPSKAFRALAGIRPRENVSLPPGSRLLITVLEPEALDTALASEASLATDWNRPQEDAAWADLAQEQ